MKARIKATGEIIDVISWSMNGTNVLFINQNGIEESREIDYYKDLEFLDTFDWDAFRNETAVKVLSTLLENRHLNQREQIEAPMFAVVYTDELIKQLKKVKE